MAILEDTVDFKVVTLDDLAETEIRSGVPAAADEKYKRWAFLSTGLAGVLAIGLVVAVATGGDDGDGGGGSRQASTQTYEGRSLVKLPAGDLGSDIVVDGKVTVLDGSGEVIASGVPVAAIASEGAGILATKTIELALTPAESSAVRAAGDGLTFQNFVEGAAPSPESTPADPAAPPPAPESAPPAEDPGAVPPG